MSAGALVVAASQKAAAAPPMSAQAEATLEAYGRIANVANQVCVHPEQFGVARSIGGKVSGQIGLSKLTKVLGDAKIGLQVGGSYSDWNGVRQQDLAAALNAANGCSERMATLMISRLPLIDLATGKRIAPGIPGAQRASPQPPRSTPPVAANSTVTGSGNVVVNGVGNTVTVAPSQENTSLNSGPLEPDARVVIAQVSFWDRPGKPGFKTVLGQLVNHGPGIAYIGVVQVHAEYSTTPLPDSALTAMGERNKLAVLNANLQRTSAIERDEHAQITMGEFPREGWDRMASGTGYFYLLVDYAYLDKKTPPGMADVAHVYGRYEKDPSSANFLLVNFSQDTNAERVPAKPLASQ